MTGPWYLMYNAEQGGTPDEIVGGDHYEGSIWQDGGRGTIVDEIVIDDEADAARIAHALNSVPVLQQACSRALDWFFTYSASADRDDRTVDAVVTAIMQALQQSQQEQV